MRSKRRVFRDGSASAQQVQWTLRAFASESVALARQSLLMPRDLRPHLPDTGEARHVVVLLHGLLATAGALRVLRERLETETGMATASFTYPPWWGVVELSQRLTTFLEPLPQTTTLHLVGHSLGGLAARYFVQVHPRDQRVVQTISLGSPFGGTIALPWLPDRLASELRPGSQILDTLDASWSAAAHVPHTSIVASHDLLVRPPSSAGWKHGEVVDVSACGHNGLLFDRRVADQVVERLRRVSAAPKARASAA
ncbi:MAG: hypothetical protein HY898_35820 [Deltaproteobacteria bacterium]|nr:hypothetical protein [Deltaproteobacteria bacterium]